MALLRGSSDDPRNHANPAMQVKYARSIASAIDANWAQYQKHEEAAIPRQTMGEVVLSCVLGEVCRRLPDYKFHSLRSGSSRERLGSITLNAQGMHRDAEHIDTIQRPTLSSDADVMVMPTITENLFTSGSIHTEKSPDFSMTGRVAVCVDTDSFVTSLPSCLQKVCIFRQGHGFVSPVLCKDLLADSLSEASSVFQPPTLLTTMREHGPAFEFKVFEVSPYRRYIMEFMGDFTFALHVPIWPECANSWGQRARLWPPNDVIDDVMSRGYHLVPIGSEDENTGLDWRMSFSLAEAILADNLPEEARKLYLFVKILYKDFVKGDCDDIATYHLKVTFFRYLELVGPSIWKMGNVVDLTADFLLYFYNLLCTRTCPHLFVEEINLIGKIRDNKKFGLMLCRFSEVIKKLTRFARRIEAKSTTGVFDCFGKDKDHIYAYMSDDMSEDTITAQIQQIVRSRTRDVLPVVDGKPIHVPRHKPILPFLTGNSFVTIGGMTDKVSDDAYTAPSSVDIPEDARTGKMMGQLIELVRRREQSRQCMRAVQELNCCVLCEHIPTSEEMYKSQFVVHLNSVTHIRGAFGRQAVIKTMSRFRMYIYLFGIVVLGLCLGLTLGSKHYDPWNEIPSGLYLFTNVTNSQPRNTSSLMNLSTQDIKRNYDDNGSLPLFDDIQREYHTSRNLTKTDTKQSEDSSSTKEKLMKKSMDEIEEALRTSGKKLFATDGFYHFQHEHNIPEIHPDDEITNVDNQDPFGNVDDSDKHRLGTDESHTTGNKKLSSVSFGSKSHPDFRKGIVHRNRHRHYKKHGHLPRKKIKEAVKSLTGMDDINNFEGNAVKNDGIRGMQHDVNKGSDEYISNKLTSGTNEAKFQKHHKITHSDIYNNYKSSKTSNRLEDLYKPVDTPQAPSSFSETDINSLYKSVNNLPKDSMPNFEDEDGVRARDDTYNDDSSSFNHDDSWHYSHGAAGGAGALGGAGGLCGCCACFRKRKRKRKASTVPSTV